MSGSASPWGEGYRAAVSLTYDDGIPNHLDIAIPMLEARGFRGTFYLVSTGDVMLARTADWKAAFQRGHEIGNHTATHPGWGLKDDTRPPEGRLENYSAADIEREVGEAAAWLDENIGRDPGRTFAYPFSQHYIGPNKDSEPYATAVRAHCAGSRLGGATVPNTPETDPYHLRGFSFGAGALAEKLIGYCEQALATGGWSILTFHGVGGPWLETAADVHQALLDYLHTQPIRVAPVRDLLQMRG